MIKLLSELDAQIELDKYLCMNKSSYVISEGPNV